MPPTLADRVFHILESINDIDQALAGISYEQFARDRILRPAVERLLEIISEASRHVPLDVKDNEKTISWQSIADFGNLARHVYHRMDTKVVWRIVKHDLPPLKAFAERVMKDEQSRSN